MTEYVFPAEADYDKYREEAGPNDHTVPPIIEELKTKAKAAGLWNLFLPAESGLTNLEYAPLAELTGWSLEIAPEALNCAAPDTGNMETLHLFATEEQRKQWLEPLLAGEIRSAFSMTEPAVASSDARNIETSIVRDGADYVINGRKWWTSGAADPRCKILIVMGRTNPEAASHQQQSMVLVPIDTPGVTVVRSTTGLRLPGPARALRDHLRQRAGAGHQSARRGGRRLRDRPGQAGAGSHPPLHARAGRSRTRAGPHGAPGPATGWRSAARWPSRASCGRQLPSPATKSTRPGCCARRRRGRSTSTATRPPTYWSRRSRRWPRRWRAT